MITKAFDTVTKKELLETLTEAGKLFASNGLRNDASMEPEAVAVILEALNIPGVGHLPEEVKVLMGFQIGMYVAMHRQNDKFNSVN